MSSLTRPPRTGSATKRGWLTVIWFDMTAEELADGVLGQGKGLDMGSEWVRCDSMSVHLMELGRKAQRNGRPTSAPAAAWGTTGQLHTAQLSSLRSTGCQRRCDQVGGVFVDSVVRRGLLLVVAGCCRGAEGSCTGDEGPASAELQDMARLNARPKPLVGWPTLTNTNCFLSILPSPLSHLHYFPFNIHLSTPVQLSSHLLFYETEHCDLDGWGMHRHGPCG